MNFEDKELIMFDLDGTLAESKAVLDPEMSELLIKLLEKKKVAVISGGIFSQFQKQFLNHLPASSENLKNLFLLPTSGTRLYTWKENEWTLQYAENLSQDERKRIIETIESIIPLLSFKFPEEVYGQRIEDRESQVTLSVLGQEAPVQLKKAWDPTKEKRREIVNALKDKLSDFDVSMGGSTSIDVTMKGVNKAYGTKKLEQFLHIPIQKMIFIGDEVIPGGNDYSEKTIGVDCIQVSGKEEVKNIIRGWVA